MKFECTCSAKFYWQTPGAKKLLSEAVDDDSNYSIIAYELVASEEVGIFTYLKVYSLWRAKATNV